MDEQVTQSLHKQFYFLTIRQLLRLNHLKYTISFIRTKVNALDDANPSDDMDETTEPQSLPLETEPQPPPLETEQQPHPLETEPQPPPLETKSQPPPLTTNTLISHLHLGSFKKEITVAEFADDSAGNGFTYAVFRKMLENFLNQFYAAHELPRERYLEVRADQKVTSNILQLEYCY